MLLELPEKDEAKKVIGMADPVIRGMTTVNESTTTFLPPESVTKCTGEIDVSLSGHRRMGEIVEPASAGWSRWT